MKTSNNINFNIMLFISGFLFFACNSSPKTGKINLNNDVQKELLQQLEDENDKFQDNNNSVDKLNTLVRLAQSPANFSLEYVDPNSTWSSGYNFFADHQVTLFFGEEYWLSGKWNLNGNELVIFFNRKEGRRGIGEPNNMPEWGVPAHYVYTYDEYVPFVEEVNIEEKYNWAEIVRNIIIHSTSQGYSNCLEFCNYALLNDDENAIHISLSGIYTFASEKELTREILSAYTKEQLRIIRNEIFARYGYIFRDNEMRTYFGQQPWYEPKLENVDKYLSEREQKNIILLRELENE